MMFLLCEEHALTLNDLSCPLCRIASERREWYERGSRDAERKYTDRLMDAVAQRTDDSATITTLQAEILSLRAALDKAEELNHLLREAIGHNAFCSCIPPITWFGDGPPPRCRRCVAVSAVLKHDAAIRAAKAGRGER